MGGFGYLGGLTEGQEVMVTVHVGDYAVDYGAGIGEGSMGGQCLVLGEWVCDKGSSLLVLVMAE